jgi:hypothetical protein
MEGAEVFETTEATVTSTGAVQRKSGRYRIQGLFKLEDCSAGSDWMILGGGSGTWTMEKV